MDIQFIGSAHGAAASAAYVCSSMCKRESYKLRRQLSDVKNNLKLSSTMRQTV